MQVTKLFVPLIPLLKETTRLFPFPAFPTIPTLGMLCSRNRDKKCLSFYEAFWQRSVKLFLDLLSGFPEIFVKETGFSQGSMTLGNWGTGGRNFWGWSGPVSFIFRHYFVTTDELWRCNLCIFIFLVFVYIFVIFEKSLSKVTKNCESWAQMNNSLAILWSLVLKFEHLFWAETISSNLNLLLKLLYIWRCLQICFGIWTFNVKMFFDLDQSLRF